MSAAAQRLPLILALLPLWLANTNHYSFAQTTVGTDSIVGTVSDPSGAVISGAKIMIGNVATRHVINLVTNSFGSFNSGPLIPGDYKIQVSAAGFSSTESRVTVLVGNSATVNVRLQIGQPTEVVQVPVQGVLSEQQIENLPFNGRNFLDLAQLEPGIQIQDGGNLMKDGYSSISFGGRFGRTARIEVDGIDVSDEIFGSTTMNIPASSIPAGTYELR